VWALGPPQRDEECSTVGETSAETWEEAGVGVTEEGWVGDEATDGDARGGCVVEIEVTGQPVSTVFFKRGREGRRQLISSRDC
jgi:hypothetical protein